ncbi:hypothetical protein PR048_029463 [Dryococelus australis]|uniref:Uncharacterized protein n=1 Tax=Dryococelus australis TaxID=614101 RepID=A0ABQ9GDI4_9NEOP|nr:hypothetical protein PR048_029463 [Dryococelus australis]
MTAEGELARDQLTAPSPRHTAPDSLFRSIKAGPTAARCTCLSTHLSIAFTRNLPCRTALSTALSSPPDNAARSRARDEAVTPDFVCVSPSFSSFTSRTLASYITSTYWRSAQTDVRLARTSPIDGCIIPTAKVKPHYGHQMLSGVANLPWRSRLVRHRSGVRESGRGWEVTGYGGLQERQEPGHILIVLRGAAGWRRRASPWQHIHARRKHIATWRRAHTCHPTDHTHCPSGGHPLLPECTVWERGIGRRDEWQRRDDPGGAGLIGVLGREPGQWRAGCAVDVRKGRPAQQVPCLAGNPLGASTTQRHKGETTNMELLAWPYNGAKGKTKLQSCSLKKKGRRKSLGTSFAGPRWLSGDPGSIPAGSLPNFRVWESCRTMPLVGGFSRGSPVSPTLSSGLKTSHVTSRPNLFTHSLPSHSNKLYYIRWQMETLLRVHVLGRSARGFESRHTPSTLNQSLIHTHSGASSIHHSSNAQLPINSPLPCPSQNPRQWQVAVCCKRPEGPSPWLRGHNAILVAGVGRVRGLGGEGEGGLFTTRARGAAVCVRRRRHGDRPARAHQIYTTANSRRHSCHLPRRTMGRRRRRLGRASPTPHFSRAIKPLATPRLDGSPRPRTPPRTDTRCVWSSAGMKWRGGSRRSPRKPKRPAASSGTTPTYENPGGGRPGIKPRSPWWEASRLATTPPRPRDG